MALFGSSRTKQITKWQHDIPFCGWWHDVHLITHPCYMAIYSGKERRIASFVVYEHPWSNRMSSLCFTKGCADIFDHQFKFHFSCWKSCHASMLVFVGAFPVTIGINYYWRATLTRVLGHLLLYSSHPQNGSQHEIPPSSYDTWSSSTL